MEGFAFNVDQIEPGWEMSRIKSQEVSLAACKYLIIQDRDFFTLDIVGFHAYMLGARQTEFQR